MRTVLVVAFVSLLSSHPAAAAPPPNALGRLAFATPAGQWLIGGSLSGHEWTRRYEADSDAKLLFGSGEDAGVSVSLGLVEGLRLGADLSYGWTELTEPKKDEPAVLSLLASSHGIQDPAVWLGYAHAPQRWPWLWLDGTWTVWGSPVSSRGGSTTKTGNAVSGGWGTSLRLDAVWRSEHAELQLGGTLAWSTPASFEGTDGARVERRARWTSDLASVLRLHPTSSAFADLGLRVSLPSTVESALDGQQLDRIDLDTRVVGSVALGAVLDSWVSVRVWLGVSSGGFDQWRSGVLETTRFGGEGVSAGIGASFLL